MNIWVPLWKYRTEGAEKWLSRMAAQGHHLEEISKWGRFRFRSAEPRTLTYGIGFNPIDNNPPPGLLEEGWQPEVLHQSWYVVSHSSPRRDIQIFPQGEEERTRARFSLHRLSLIIQVALCSILIPLWIIAALTRWQLIEENAIPQWIWPLLFTFTFLYIVSLSLFILVSRGKDRLVLEAVPTDDFIVKRKFGWTSSPDKLEQWLEAMEAQGFHLHQVQRNKFYYTRSRQRRMKFCVDYQLLTDQPYYSIHTEAGWTPIYTGHSHLGTWTIWAQEYQDSPPPSINDCKTQRKTALQVALTTSLSAAVYLPWAMTLAKPEVNTLIKHGTQFLSIGLLSLYGYILFLTLWKTLLAWLYLRRMLKV